jgi:hypothetical protein
VSLLSLVVDVENSEETVGGGFAEGDRVPVRGCDGDNGLDVGLTDAGSIKG